MAGAPVLGRAQGDRYSAVPVTEPRGRARVRWARPARRSRRARGLGELGGFELTGDPDVEVDAITHDSRRVEPGCVLRVHPRRADRRPRPRARGRRPGGGGAARGAPAAAGGVAGPGAERARRARPLAATLHGHPSAAMRVLGVTGTNGKTTTTYLLEAIGRAAGERVGVIGTVGARIAGQTVATAAHHPRGERPAGAAGADARRRASRRSRWRCRRTRSSSIASTACSSPRCASPTSVTSTSTTTARWTRTSRRRRDCSTRDARDPRPRQPR